MAESQLTSKSAQLVDFGIESRTKTMMMRVADIKKGAEAPLSLIHSQAH